MAVNDDERRGAFGSARALLGKVVGRVVDAALGTTRQRAAEHEDGTRSRAPAEARRRKARAEDLSAHPVGMSDVPEGSVVAIPAGDDRVLMSWRLSAGALERARRVLGADGELRARIIVVSPDDGDVVATRVREQADVEARGEWVVTDLPPGALCAAAVGLSRDERFVSAGHARIVRV